MRVFPAHRSQPLVFAAVRPSGREIPKTVTVEYVVADPSAARVVGMRFFYNSWSVVWVLLFPLISLGLIAPRLLSASDQISLLRNGALAHGTLVEKRSSGEDGLVALVFEFTPPAGDAAYGRCHLATSSSVIIVR